MVVEHVAALDALVREQHGLVTGEQATALLGAYRKRRWVTEGRVISVQPGVFRMAGAPTTWHQSLKAAQLATGGVVSHRSSAELWGLLQPSGHVEVSIHPQAQIPDEAMDACLKTFEDFCVVTQSVREGIDVKVSVSRPATAG